MANYSNAYATFKVKGVGQELADYFDNCEIIVLDFDRSIIDKNGDFELESPATGRWSYKNTLDESFSDEAFDCGEDGNKYLERLKEAIIRTNGSIEIFYNDVETGVGFLGAGYAGLTVSDGKVHWFNSFTERPYTITEYAEITGFNIDDAVVEVLGDEEMYEFEEHIESLIKGDKELLKYILRKAEVDSWAVSKGYM